MKIRCEFRVPKNANNRLRSGVPTIQCDKDPVWVIRLNGGERFACNNHKSEGVLVRKIRSK